MVIFRAARSSLPLLRHTSYRPLPFTRANSSGTNAQRASYASFKRPFAKVFLGAFLTYQLIYLAWLKLETDETTVEKDKELASLETQLRELTAKGS